MTNSASQPARVALGQLLYAFGVKLGDDCGPMPGNRFLHTLQGKGFMAFNVHFDYIQASLTLPHVVNGHALYIIVFALLGGVYKTIGAIAAQLQ